MAHSFLTVAAAFEASRVPAVNEALDALGNPASEAIRERLRGSGVHFVSMSVIPADRTHGPYLVLEATTDEADSAQILAELIGTDIASVLEAAGHGTRNQSTATTASFLREHSRKVGLGLFATPGLCFSGSPGMTTTTIREEYELARKVRLILESGAVAGTPLQILQQVRAQLPPIDRAASPLLAPPSSTHFPVATILRGFVLFTWPYLLVGALVSIGLGWQAARQAGILWGLIAFGFLVALFTLGLLGVAAVAYAKLRRREVEDVPDNSPPDPATLNEVYRRENRNSFEQNHLLGVSVMKPGLLRNVVLRLVFWVIVQTASTVYRPGFLGELGTIHFARWIRLPGTNKLLFFSNYGGSWESYLEDFITKAHAGLTGVWSNTLGFPRTKNVFQDGAIDGERFKRWARRQQQPTRFWYSAYPHLTTARIRLNSGIRLGLATAATEDEASEWLSCFGSRPRSARVLENGEIQAAVFGGFGHLPNAAALLIRLPEELPQARAWLSELATKISFGDTKPQSVARIVAFTATGLKRLGATDELMREFPGPFQEGMSEPHRANFLGDTGDDKPAEWLWGNSEKPVDVVLLLYADSAAVRTQELGDRLAELRAAGASLVHQIDLSPFNPSQPVREHFGFVDGVSQPIIRGTRRWVAESDAIHIVEPGEFILGYYDNRGYLPITPTVSPEQDPRNVLSGLGNPVVRELPSFSGQGATQRRDFGQNGSYLVMRQLEQDVALFHKTLESMAQGLVGRAGVPNWYSPQQIVEWLGAKMVGRWRDGTSLIRNPHEPGTGWTGTKARGPDNSFLAGEEDPMGLRCPYGSHIRRTNPRDSFTPGSPNQIAISNRHRLLRMGRSYDPGEGETKPGLLFMCLNADIERQFEFVQQTWMGARLFHGLDGEVDPILGRGGKGGRLTVPTESGPLLISRLQDFVRVRGGGYFFMPSRRAIRFLAGSDATITAESWRAKIVSG